MSFSFGYTVKEAVVAPASGLFVDSFNVFRSPWHRQHLTNRYVAKHPASTGLLPARTGFELAARLLPFFSTPRRPRRASPSAEMGD